MTRCTAPHDPQTRLGKSSWPGNSLLALAAAQDTGAARGDEADLLPGARLARDGGGVAHVLVITTAVRVLDGVHRRTAHLRPAIALDTVLVEVVARLEHRLVQAPAACDDTNDSPTGRGDGLTRARRQANPGLRAIIGVPHDHARGA